MYKGLNKRFSQAVFMIAKREGNDIKFLGTGFLASQGYLLTCSHIINPIDSIIAIKIGEPNAFNPITLNKVNFKDLILVQNDTIKDVALLKFKTNWVASIPPNVFGNTENIECGSSIAIIGFPFGDSGLHLQSITHGIISSKAFTQSGVKLLQFDSMIHEGNSGSPLIDLQSNQIIGIVTKRFNPSPAGGIRIGQRQLGVETNISYATVIEYGIELLKNEIK